MCKEISASPLPVPEEKEDKIEEDSISEKSKTSEYSALQKLQMKGDKIQQQIDEKEK